MSIIKITKDNFESEVIKSDKPVLIDFWADWCPPCQMLSPVVEEIAKEMDNVKVCKVNTDDEMMLAQKFSILNIPTLILFKNGKITGKIVGYRPKSDIIALINY